MSRHRIAVLVLVVTLPACAAAGAGGAPTSRATTATIGADVFDETRIVVAKSLPPQFEVQLLREMPTPGWRFEVDGVDVNQGNGHIVARVTEIAPTGITSQVITKTTCRIPLGALHRGRWLLEVRLRRGTSAEYFLAEVFVIDAR